MKKRFVARKRLRRFVRRYRNIALIGILLFIFPLVVGFVYFLPIPQYIAVESGDLLSYYGTAFGLFASYITYRLEKKEREREADRRNSPRLIVDIERYGTIEDCGLFYLRIQNKSEGTLTHFGVYHEHLCNAIETEKLFRIAVTSGSSDKNLADVDVVCWVDSAEIEKNGYPKYIQILCEGNNGDSWICDFLKDGNPNSVHYYPVSPYKA